MFYNSCFQELTLKYQKGVGLKSKVILNIQFNSELMFKSVLHQWRRLTQAVILVRAETMRGRRFLKLTLSSKVVNLMCVCLYIGLQCSKKKERLTWCYWEWTRDKT